MANHSRATQMLATSAGTPSSLASSPGHSLGTHRISQAIAPPATAMYTAMSTPSAAHGSGPRYSVSQ